MSVGPGRLQLFVELLFSYSKCHRKIRLRIGYRYRSISIIRGIPRVLQEKSVLGVEL